MKNFVLVLILISFYSCNNKNDYIVNGKRAGLIKIGSNEQVINKLLKEYDVQSFQCELDKYKIVSQNAKTIMHLKFFQGSLDAIKIYDDRYTTKYGIAINNTAQEVANMGFKFPSVDIQREGILFELYKLKNSREMKYTENVQFGFDKKVAYVYPCTRKIGRYAKVKFLVVGDYFDIKKDTLTINENNIIRNKKHGKLIDELYVNDYFGIRINIPSNWTYYGYNPHSLITELFTIENNQNGCRLSLVMIPAISINHAGQYLDTWLSRKKSKRLGAYSGGELYRLLYKSDNNDKLYADYAIIANGNILIFKSECSNESELPEIEEIVMSLINQKGHNILD